VNRLRPAVAALLLAGCSPGAPVGPPERLVLIVVDMLRADHLGCFGGASPTPVIDRLAREGMPYPQVVAAFHQTTMSMASIFTGQTPSLESGDVRAPLDWNGRTWCGMARFATPGDDGCIPLSLGTLAETLREAGYRTIGIASNPLTFEPGGYRQGFEDWTEVGTVVETLAIDQPIALTRAAGPVNDAVARALTRRGDDRFFLYVHYMDVHDYQVTGTSYETAVEAADAAVGSLLEQLRGAGLLANTAVVLTSDHGERLGEKHALSGMPGHFGNPSFETLLRVPLIVWPRSTRPVPAVFRGQDTRRLIEGLAGIDEPASSELREDEVLLTERWFLSYRRYPWKSLRDRRDGRLHLFNLAEDPGEQRDVAAEHASVAREHEERIGVLAASLSAPARSESGLTESDKERLRALGYLD